MDEAPWLPCLGMCASGVEICVGHEEALEGFSRVRSTILSILVDV